VSKDTYEIRYAEYNVCGKRPEMEDAFIADLTFGKKYPKVAKEKKLETTNQATGALFGVFDGHSGSSCSEQCSKQLPKILYENKHFPSDIPTALKETFLEVDRQFLQNAKKNKLEDGSTGIVALIYKDTLFVANAGDSRGVMCQNDSLVALSDDHKPDNETEKARIEKYGGAVKKGRINGKLAVSRGFGDLPYKDKDTFGEKFVTVEPDVQSFAINKDVSFIILACDGLWDTISSDEAVAFVSSKLKSPEYNFRSDDNRGLYNICIELTTLAYNKGSTDNISIVLVQFNHKS